MSVITTILPPSAGTAPVAAYCRVSTDDPSQEDSLAVQRSHWEQVISDHEGWTFAGIYAEKESGTHAETRPELMRMIEDCRAGKIRVIVTKSVSRFSRNTVDCLNLIRTLKTMSVSIFFEKENIDTGAMTSELFLSILASFAAEESRSISRTVKLGYTHRFKEGEFVYKRPPYGYHVVDGALEIEQSEAEIVAEIFDSALLGLSPTAIAHDLEEKGISTKYSASWTRNTILAIISNITYTGDALFQKTFKDDNYASRRNDGQLDQFFVPARHDAIVSREVFILANTTLGLPNPYDRLPVIEDLTPVEDGERTVTVIKALPKGTKAGQETLRVAAYCRVSTDMDEQEGSYEVQCSHYRELITNHSGWVLVDIFADEGTSGTSLRHRDDFNRMIEEAEAGKIDLILTKSISRFARNTLDCLTIVRKLKALGIGISFEKEGLDTLDGTGEVILTILASIAQQESASISQNIRLGIQYRFQQGIPKVNVSRFLGYDKDKKGQLVINEAQAVVVRRIYRDLLDGFSVDMVAADLRREGIPSGSGCTKWPCSSVKYVLTNEKYVGDLLLQKTLVEDFLTHHMVKNRGQLPQYYVRDAHDPIVPRTIFERAADELWLRGQVGRKGGEHFGSREALKNRVFCRCGEQMKKLRRLAPVYRCDICKLEMPEADIKSRVMDAVRLLPQYKGEVESMISALPLKDADRAERAKAQRREWHLLNLLTPGQGSYTPNCADEDDFRARTAKRITEWTDDALVRILEKVELDGTVHFKGGLTVSVKPCEC